MTQLSKSLTSATSYNSFRILTTLRKMLRHAAPSRAKIEETIRGHKPFELLMQVFDAYNDIVRLFGVNLQFITLRDLLHMFMYNLDTEFSVLAKRFKKETNFLLCCALRNQDELPEDHFFPPFVFSALRSFAVRETIPRSKFSSPRFLGLHHPRRRRHDRAVTFLFSLAQLKRCAPPPESSMKDESARKHREMLCERSVTLSKQDLAEWETYVRKMLDGFSFDFSRHRSWYFSDHSCVTKSRLDGGMQNEVPALWKDAIETGEIPFPAGEIMERNVPLRATVCALDKDPLKARVITRQESIEGYLKPLQSALHGFLKKKPEFCFIGRPLGNNSISDIPDQEGWMTSGDYEAATDSFPQQFMTVFGRVLEEKIEAVPAYFHLVRRACEPRLLGYPRDLDCHNLALKVCEDAKHIYYQQTNGQLMGSLLSFPVLCLVNGFLSDRLGYRKINGDDLLAWQNEEQFEAFKARCDRFGIKLSLNKSFRHPVVGTMNSRLIFAYNTKWTPHYREWHDTPRSFRPSFPYLSVPMLLAKHDHRAKEKQDPEREAQVLSHLSKVGHLARLFDLSKVQQAFFSRLRREYKTDRVFLPRRLGGLGLCHSPSRLRLDDSDLFLVGMHILGYSTSGTVEQTAYFKSDVVRPRPLVIERPWEPKDSEFNRLCRQRELKHRQIAEKIFRVREQCPAKRTIQRVECLYDALHEEWRYQIGRLSRSLIPPSKIGLAPLYRCELFSPRNRFTCERKPGEFEQMIVETCAALWTEFDRLDEIVESVIALARENLDFDGVKYYGEKGISWTERPYFRPTPFEVSEEQTIPPWMPRSSCSLNPERPIYDHAAGVPQVRSVAFVRAQSP